MKKPDSLFSSVMIFVLAQVAWVFLLGLWIYWYVSNYIIFEYVEENAPPQIISYGTNVFALVSGIVLLIFISMGMSFIFIYLNRQMNINKLYDNFIASVTHELKSPLSSIQLYLETLEARRVPEQAQQEFIKLMMKDTERLNGLISSILHLSAFEQKSKSGRHLHNYRVYSANKIFPDIIRKTYDKFDLEKQAVELKGKLDCFCVVDSNWMEIVFFNLFDNAIKYSTDKPKISILLQNTHKNITITFSDVGIGIAPKDQKKIFNKFQRLQHPEIPNVKGTGLGLYWVREIVKYHGGKIQVRSKGNGTGTTFVISLPVYKSSKKRYIKSLLKFSGKK